MIDSTRLSNVSGWLFSPERVKMIAAGILGVIEHLNESADLGVASDDSTDHSGSKLSHLDSLPG